MAKINIEKVIRELAKGSVDEQLEAFTAIKNFVTINVQNEQKELESKANERQSTLDRLTNAN